MIVSNPNPPKRIEVTIELDRFTALSKGHVPGQIAQQYICDLLDAESRAVNQVDNFNSVVVVTDMMLDNTDVYVYRPEFGIGKGSDKLVVAVKYRELGDHEKARLIKAMYRQIRKGNTDIDTAAKNCFTASRLGLDLDELNPHKETE